jgi:hypothetical protein
MGTTDQGYSVYAQVIYGGRISLVVALVATVIAMTIAIVLGLLAAYRGGWVDEIVNLVANIFIVIHGLPLLIVELIRGLQHRGLVRRRSKADAYYLVTDEIDHLPDVPLIEWLAERELSSMAPALAEHARLAALLGEDFSTVERGLRVVFTTVFFRALEFLGFADVNKVSWGTTLYWATVNSPLLQGRVVALRVPGWRSADAPLDRVHQLRHRRARPAPAVEDRPSGRPPPRVRPRSACEPCRPRVSRRRVRSRPRSELRDLVVEYGTDHGRSLP